MFPPPSSSCFSMQSLPYSTPLLIPLRLSPVPPKGQLGWVYPQVGPGQGGFPKASTSVGCPPCTAVTGRGATCPNNCWWPLRVQSISTTVGLHEGWQWSQAPVKQFFPPNSSAGPSWTTGSGSQALCSGLDIFPPPLDISDKTATSVLLIGLHPGDSLSQHLNLLHSIQFWADWVSIDKNCSTRMSSTIERVAD